MSKAICPECGEAELEYKGRIAELEAQLAATEKERNAFQDQCISLKVKHRLEVEGLQAQLAAVTAERDEWKNDAMNGSNAGYLREQITELQALLAKKDDAMKNCYPFNEQDGCHYFDKLRLVRALELNSPTDALRQHDAALLRKAAGHLSVTEGFDKLHDMADQIEKGVID